jgi:sugar phosphate isomerase/epimerase
MTAPRSQLDRRQWLLQAGAFTLGAGLAGSRASAAPPGATSSSAAAPIELGFSLYGMKTLTLDAALEACAKIGYDAVELACMPDWPAAPKRLSKADRQHLRERLSALGLSLPVLMENVSLGVDEKTNQANLERLKLAAELAHDLQIGQLPLIETVVGGAAGAWESVKQKFADQLVGWARLAEQQQTVIAIKPHRFGAMNTPADATWLVKQVHSPWIKLAYDYSHFAFRDMPLADTLREMMPETVFVHVKDTVMDKGKAKFLLPGEGDIDYPELFRQLNSLGYRGCVCVEVSGMVQGQKGYDPIAAARRSYEPLAAAMTKAGIARRRAG